MNSVAADSRSDQAARLRNNQALLLVDVLTLLIGSLVNYMVVIPALIAASQIRDVPPPGSVIIVELPEVAAGDPQWQWSDLTIGVADHESHVTFDTDDGVTNRAAVFVRTPNSESRMTRRMCIRLLTWRPGEKSTIVAALRSQTTEESGRSRVTRAMLDQGLTLKILRARDAVADQPTGPTLELRLSTRNAVAASVVLDDSFLGFSLGSDGHGSSK